MPDPLLFGKALAATWLAGAAMVFASRHLLTPRFPVAAAVVQVLSMVVASSLGWAILGIRPAIPPFTALDRFLLIVFPVAVALELLRFASRIPDPLQIIGRGSLSVAAPFVLLYGSVYFRLAAPEWSGGLIVVWLLLGSLGLTTTWSWATGTVEHRGDRAVPLAFALATFAAGVFIMLGGYLKGGSAALPLAAATLGGAAWWPDSAAKPSARPNITGVAIVGWFGILIVGRYFGHLSAGASLAVTLAPLLALIPDSWLRFCRAEWHRTAVRLALVAVPIIVALVPAVLEFQRKMRPLIAAERRVTNQTSW